MIVDFRNLSSDLAEKFENNKSLVMKDYNLISSRLLNLSDRLPWLLSNTTSRNVFHSRLFYYLRCQKMLHELLNENNFIEKVITDDQVLYKLLSQKYNVSFVGSHHKLCINKNILRIFVWSLMALFCKSKKRINKLLSSSNNTIIDTDIAKHSDKYNDRYYGNVIDRLSKCYQRKCFFNIIYLPYPTRKDISTIVKNSNHNILFLWDFLSFIDYIRAFFNLKNYSQFKKLDLDYLGIDQSFALKSIYKDNISFYFYLAFLYERVIYRMKKMNVDIGLYIDWFENQSFDKSFYWAMNKYYPDVKTHAYIGFMPDTTENPITIATNEEVDLNIAPRNIFVCNQALKDQYDKSGYKGNVKIAPFYRAADVWNLCCSNERYENFTILVPMGLMKQEVDEKVSFFVEYKKKYVDSKISIMLKPHPVYDASSIYSLIKDVSDIIIIDGSIYKYLEKVDVVVASNSTTTYEALALGKPIIYYLDPLRLLSLSRPQKVPDDMWLKVQDVESLNLAINKVEKMDRLQLVKVGETLKEYYFTKETTELNNQLFDIN